MSQQNNLSPGHKRKTNHSYSRFLSNILQVLKDPRHVQSSLSPRWSNVFYQVMKHSAPPPLASGISLITVFEVSVSVHPIRRSNSSANHAFIVLQTCCLTRISLYSGNVLEIPFLSRERGRQNLLGPSCLWFVTSPLNPFYNSVSVHTGSTCPVCHFDMDSKKYTTNLDTTLDSTSCMLQ